MYHYGATFPSRRLMPRLPNLVFPRAYMARLLALTTVACGTGTAFAEPAQAPTPPAAVQGGRTVLKDEDTVVVRAQEVWEDPNADTLHFEGQFDMRTPEWRILAVRATVYGAVNDPDRITVNGTPAKVWIQRSSSATGAMETIYGEGAQLVRVTVGADQPARVGREGEVARVVAAGDPSRTPEVMVGFSGSKGMPFLLQVSQARSRLCSATLPVSRLGRRSTSMRWVSVPPDTMSRPPSTSVAAKVRAFSTTAAE